MRRGVGSERGFTLVELLMTIAIVGIVSVSAVPFFTNVGAATADAGAKKVLADINYVRKLAKNRNGIYGIRFDAVAETYTVYQYDAATNTSTTIEDPTTHGNFVVNFNTAPGLRGINIQNPNFGGTTEVRFNAQGFPQNGANVLLGAAGSVQLTGSTTTKIVSVQPNTGEVSLQ